MPDLYTVTIPCKGYVKYFLENNCGTPVNLKIFGEFLAMFKTLLIKNADHVGSIRPSPYTETVTVIIPPDIFYRNGWELDAKSVMSFNIFLERRIKFIMRQYISFNHALGSTVSDCIRSFQEEYNFPEHIWSYETIKKDFDRNGEILFYNHLKGLKREMNEIFFRSMQKQGIISKECYIETSL